MKKLFLALAIFGFLSFGALGIQNILAATHSIEVVNFDKDPKKVSDKKSKDSKATAEMKAENTSASTTTVKDASCESSCVGKSSSCCSSKSDCASSSSCCSKDSPDKK